MIPNLQTNSYFAANEIFHTDLVNVLWQQSLQFVTQDKPNQSGQWMLGISGMMIIFVAGQ